MLKGELKRKLNIGTHYCDICGGKLGMGDRIDENFEYSKTKRGEVWVHTSCWDKLYGKVGK